jgi:hypothetical protein
MDTQGDEAAFLTELERTVRSELAMAESGPPAGETSGGTAEQVPDPDAEFYEIRLRSLLGAVRATEDGAGPGGAR